MKEAVFGLLAVLLVMLMVSVKKDGWPWEVSCPSTLTTIAKDQSRVVGQ